MPSLKGYISTTGRMTKGLTIVSEECSSKEILFTKTQESCKRHIPSCASSIRTVSKAILVQCCPIVNGIWSEPNLSILISFFIIKTQTLWKIISTAQLRRRHPCSLLELSAEAGRVHIAHSQADVIDRHVRVEQ